MEKTEFPFVKCLNPIYSVNRYNGEPILVPCGHCKACLLNRSRKMSMLCSQEEAHHRYAYFVTLTYDMKHLPLMRLEFIGDCPAPTWKVRDICPRSETAWQLMDMNWHKSAGVLSMLLDKIHARYPIRKRLLSKGNYYENTFGYACRRDLVLFMKRLRKRMYKESNESIRFYAVSEYGPRTFRPHFHILLFFDDPKTLTGLQKNISASWPYGRVDASLSRGKCSSYVAQYVNSFVSLPELFAVRAAKPFCSHSVFFGTEFYKSQKERMYSLEPERFISQSCVLNGKYVTFSPWRSFTLVFYPKCKGFSCKSYSQLLYAYTLLPTLERALQGRAQTPSAVAKELIRIHRDGLENCVFDCADIGVIQKALDYFAPALNLIDEDSVLYGAAEQWQRCFSSITAELYVSRHFVNFCCDGKENEFPYKVKKIVEFYSAVDYLRLTDFLATAEEFSKAHPEEVKYLYATFKPKDGLEEYKRFETYTKFYAETCNDIDKATKHKVLNDLNSIFIID